MPCELLLLRHAKSDWTQSCGDFDRPLNPRGERDAARIGGWLQHQATLPDTLLCSPARRAAQTAHAVCTMSGIAESGILWDERLYLASADTLRQVIGELPDTCRRVLVVGHNPGLEDLLLQIAPAALNYRKDHKLLTTATLAWLDLAGSWSEPGKASLRNFVRARELAES